MKNRITRVIVAMALAITVLISSFPAIAAETKPEYTIKITSNNVPFTTMGNDKVLDFIYAGALGFKNYVEANSNGRIAVEIYHSGQLGGTVEALQQCMQGVIQACFAGDGEMATLYPNLQTLSIPYLFNNRTEYYAMLDSKFMATMYEDIKAKLDLRIISSADNGGFRNFSNNKRPIKTAADLKGLKIRCMEIPAHKIMLESFGAMATPMAWAELYTALQTGVVDGQENSPGTTLNGSLNEVQKYYTLDGHSISTLYLIVNEKFYNTLPADLQKVVTDAGAIAQDCNRGVTNANESLAIEYLVNSGLEVYAPTLEEKETFKVAQGPVIDWLKGQIGNEYVDQFMKAVNDIEAGVVTEDTATVSAAPATTDATGEKTQQVVEAPIAQPASPFNNITIIAIVIAGIAILIAIYTFTKKSKKQ